ncbi:MAG: hypothetical protein HY738_07155 [Bacteroidia bacterium]|nr:hypothetical protein [Bacteroidia bacterium]
MKIILLLYFLNFFALFASSQIRVSEWRDHLSFFTGKKIATCGNKIYCATEDALFSYNKSDNSLEKITKITGLSDIGVSTINYYSNGNILIVGYKNGNIDLLIGNEIINIPDIKNKQITGNKSINNILFNNTFAYLSCGFGIVVLNLEKKEIFDTYYIGDNGSKIQVYEIAFDGEFFYAATENGIYKADINSSNLANYSSWNRMIDIPNTSHKFIVYNDAELFFNIHTIVPDTPSLYRDTVYSYYNGVYSMIEATKNELCYSIVSSNNKLLVFHWWFLSYFDNGNKSIISYNNSRPRNGIYDNGQFWIADEINGLVNRRENGEVFYYCPNGPRTNSIIDMDIEGGILKAAPGGRDAAWNNIWRTGEVYTFSDQTWSTCYIESSYSCYDIVSVIVNPSNPHQSYAGSWGGGLLEFYDNQLVNVYRNNNSTLNTIFPTQLYYRISGLAFDSNNNLWITNSMVHNPVSVKMADGTWQTLEYDDFFNGDFIDEIIVTNIGHKWITLPRGVGLFVFDEKGTFDNIEDDDYKSFSILDEHGESITNDIYSIAQDKDGYIWLGTNAGVVVYYNPENVFSGDNFYAQRIIVEVDGTAQYLLETETVTDIEINGANQKWFATHNAGVFLMSEDGTKQVLNFNTENSPILSNTVFCIAIDGDSGEVFFGTDKGIVSYKGTATEGRDGFKDVYIYPNPVRPGYSGLITITNLVANCNVKITDIGGCIVYETTAEGGQATWDGRNFDGYKVKSGVYMVFCTNEDGSKKHVTKMVIVN